MGSRSISVVGSGFMANVIVPALYRLMPDASVSVYCNVPARPGDRTTDLYRKIFSADAVVDCSGKSLRTYDLATCDERKNILFCTDPEFMVTLAPLLPDDVLPVVELPGDQPSELVAMYSRIRAMGRLKAFVNFKRYYNPDATTDDIAPFAKQQKTSLPSTVEMTDGTKLAYELVLAAKAVSGRAVCPGGGLSETFTESADTPWSVGVELENDKYEGKYNLSIARRALFPGSAVACVVEPYSDSLAFSKYIHAAPNEGKLATVYQNVHLCAYPAADAVSFWMRTGALKDGCIASNALPVDTQDVIAVHKNTTGMRGVVSTNNPDAVPFTFARCGSVRQGNNYGVVTEEQVILPDRVSALFDLWKETRWIRKEQEKNNDT